MITLLKFIPVVIVAGMVMSGIDILIAASLGLFVAAAVFRITEKKALSEIMNIAVEGAKEATLMAFILMLAYAVAEIFMATGVGASAIQIFVSLGVTGKTVAVVAFLATSLLAVATGTAWGTFAACFPIFIWLSSVVGGNPGLTFAACIGGSSFGDNIGLISDTTILSSGVQGVKVVDRVRSQGVWSIICLALSAIAFYVVSSMWGLPSTTGDVTTVLANIPQETWDVIQETRPSVIILLEQVQSGVPLYMIIPVIIIVAMAVMRVDTVICLSSGIFISVIFGIFAGTVESFGYVFDLIGNGFSSAGSWAVIMLFWAMGFGALMRSMKAFDPIVVLFLKISKNVRQLLVCNGLLCLVANMVLNEEMSQMATVGPVIKEIVDKNVEGSEEDKYKLRLRNAVFSDSVGVMSASLIPWHTGVAYYMGLAISVYPLYVFQVGDLYLNFMSLISIASIYILTLTGADRFVPLFGLPSEPNVRLKKESLVDVKYQSN